VCLGGFGGLSLEGVGEVPEQQFLYSADGVVSDLGRHGAEIEFRVESIQFCSSSFAPYFAISAFVFARATLLHCSRGQSGLTVRT